jgi:hypothetical protein
VFTPGTPIPDAALSLLRALGERLGYAQKAAEKPPRISLNGD